jgi:general stress protein CsbA
MSLAPIASASYLVTHALEGGGMTILGFTLYTWFHILISLVMLVAGFVVVKDLLRSRIDPTWMAVFLVSGVLTNVTGFGFPFDRLTESHYTAIISLIALAAVILALYVFKLAGPWRWIFALGAVLAFYTDALVTIAQIFKKVPALGAPTASNEPQFVAAQLLLLAIIIWLCVKAVRQFRSASA